MTTLILLRGQSQGRQFPCTGDTFTIGRQADCTVCLDDPAVSRKHARIVLHGKGHLVEDLGSSNGTYLNGTRLSGRQPLSDNDTLKVGPYVFSFRTTPQDTVPPEPIVRYQVNALSSNASIFTQNAAHKLQVVVEIAQNLGRTLEVNPLLDKLLEQLFRLFPQAGRGLVILCEGEQFVVRAQRMRHERTNDIGGARQEGDFPFSRSLVKRALEEGVGLLSEDVSDDPNVSKTATLMALNLRSFLCVPLLGIDNRRLGVIQLDCIREGQYFKHEDLDLLTAVSLHVASVLENAALHEERLREERFKQELALAREIQQAFLPNDFRPIASDAYELFAGCAPAREVSGDLYDFFPLPDGRLALFLGDVSGKGMPAALYMIAVRTLIRHLAPAMQSPGQTLLNLNNALVADNPTNLFVTMIHAMYDPKSGEIIISSGGHPQPLLRDADGRTETVALRSAMMLGYASFRRPPEERRLTLGSDELLAFYTDGLTEAFTPKRETMFGVERLQEALTTNGGKALPECFDAVRKTITDFVQCGEQQDDQTLLLLRQH